MTRHEQARLSNLTQKAPRNEGVLAAVDGWASTHLCTHGASSIAWLKGVAAGGRLDTERLDLPCVVPQVTWATSTNDGAEAEKIS